MITSLTTFEYERFIGEIEKPCLVISTKVGKGNISIADSLLEYDKDIKHIIVEDFLPQNAITEDLTRYKFISNNLTFLLNLIYKIPLFYYRKYLREKLFNTTDFNRLASYIVEHNFKTIICISHRPSFWTSLIKNKKKLNFKLIGIQSEFGISLGWKFIFWDSVNIFLSPIPKQILHYSFPPNLNFIHANIPVKSCFKEIALDEGSLNKILIVAGFWGQIKYKKLKNIISEIMTNIKLMEINIVCGTNTILLEKLTDCYKNNPQIKLFGEVKDLSPLMRNCASIITKPGISTIVEAYTAQRKIFLLKGMPVAEDNNAVFSIKHFNAEWFTISRLKTWYENKI